MSLVVLRVTEGAGAGSEHPVEGELMIGRDASAADLVVEDAGVSRSHARLLADGDALTVEDLGSSNGTFVNGDRIGPGAIELADGDEIQVGGTVLAVAGAEGATVVMGAGAAPTAEHPGPGPRAPARPAPARRRAARTGPDPTDQSATNLPALAAVFLGPLSIFLVIFSTGAAFFVSLPCAVAAVVLASVGKRKVDRGETDSFRALAVLGQVTGIIGIVLSTVALVAFLIVAALLDTAAESLDELIDAIRDEIEDRGVEVPEIPQ